MVLNTTKISFGSLLLFLTLACINESKNAETTIVKKKSIDEICKYYTYDAHQIVSNLGCKNCHVPYGDRMDKNILTMKEISVIDSLKLVNYTFTRKHKGWYSKSGPYKDAKMDTLSDCEIKSVIRYIKDEGRDTPMSNQ